MNWMTNMIKTGIGTGIHALVPARVRTYVEPVVATVVDGEDERDAELRQLVGQGPKMEGWEQELYDMAVSGYHDAQAQQQRTVLAQIVTAQEPAIAASAASKGLAANVRWTAPAIDAVAADIMRGMLTHGAMPSASDAAIARAAVRTWLARSGGSSIGGDDVMGDNVLSALGTLLAAPAKASWWLTKKTAGGVASAAQWTGRKLGLTHGASAPSVPPPMQAGPTGLSPQQMAAYRGLAARKAAASARILAAERAHGAAIARQNDAAEIQAVAEKAAEAEEAAQTAEQIAVQAQADAAAGVTSAPEAVSGALYDHELAGFLSEGKPRRRHHPWIPGS